MHSSFCGASKVRQHEKDPGCTVKMDTRSDVFIMGPVACVGVSGGAPSKKPIVPRQPFS